ncbi:hypothetical protein [Pantoea dispersa]|uniref:hypothetical protein n=1 Tax=Pantoea dispersa TaxID=59814 RepID=UPI001CA63DC9|nr:hypothetical protein [Pantoea dispersa]QZY96531.1 hypothetical protein K7X52_08895 [Pantoea dispersa]
MPKELISSWEQLLDSENLREMALNDSVSNSTGGQDKFETDTHLASKYTGSCARTILSIIDPLDKAELASDTYISIFSGGDVFLLDIPAGAGSGSISILSTLYELRRENILPRYPLNLKILAGEISPSARDYFTRQLKELKPLLETQAIIVEHEITSWNAINLQNNLDFVVKMYEKGKGIPCKLILITNFSGFLGSDQNWESAKSNFESIFHVNKDDNSHVIWIEPQINKARRIFEKIAKWFFVKFPFFTQESKGEDDLHCETEINCLHPLKDVKFKARMKLMCFRLMQRNDQ